MAAPFSVVIRREGDVDAGRGEPLEKMVEEPEPIRASGFPRAL